jgi:small-conductance mechanosensitive channel/CRP-like cAMP-binding protein
VLAAGIAFLLITVVLRQTSLNRQIRRKLLISAGLFAVNVAAALLLAYAPITPVLRQQIRLAQPLLLAFGIVNAIVVTAINPWRVDRLPERFPGIVQDAVIIALFGITATLILQERVFTATAVGAVVIGLALQETLGNLFAGLAIQVEKPFRVGHWVSIGGRDGLVSEITWRATKIRTLLGNFVVVPNSAIARETITNFSEPTMETAFEVDISAGYDVPPNRVKAAIRDAIRDEPLIVRGREPEVRVVDFLATVISYRVRVWTVDFSAQWDVRDRVRSRIYYAFRRLDIGLPNPVQVQLKPSPASEPDSRSLDRLLRAAPIFSSLSEEQCAGLLEASHIRLYAAHDVIVREGDQARSLFVVCEGEVAVTLARASGELARLGPGEFFGEMSLLTGETRGATATAATDCELLEIGADGFRAVALADPTVVERVATAVAVRRAALESHRTSKAVAPPSLEPPQTLLERVKRFLQL